MGTKWAEVICDYAMVEISDVRLSDEMAENPALFFRKMALYMKNAIPRFNRPAEQQEWLRYMAPAYDSFVYTAENGAVEGEIIETGKTGFELCSAEVVTLDELKNPCSQPLEGCQYDTESGSVTLPVGIVAGGRLSVDFYSDGEFLRELSGEEKRILSLCVQMVWETRYAADWLGRAPKVKDKTFSVESESNKVRADTARLQALENSLNQEIAKYEQNLVYRNAIRGARRLQPNI